MLKELNKIYKSVPNKLCYSEVKFHLSQAISKLEKIEKREHRKEEQTKEEQKTEKKKKEFIKKNIHDYEETLKALDKMAESIQE